MGFPFDVMSWFVRARYKLTTLALSDGEGGELQCDSAGNLKVRAVGGPVISGYHRRRGSKGDVVRSGAGGLVGAWGYNKGSAACYVLLIDRASAPVNGNATIYEAFLVPAGGSFSYLAPEPISVSAGLARAASSTDETVTLIATNDIGITVAYQ